MRDYDFTPYRPPSESESILLRITRGCPWNRCAFCSMYKDVKFELKSAEEIGRDVSAALGLYGQYGLAGRNIFIGDSDSLVFSGFADAVLLVRQTFPEAGRITTYARARTLLQRSDEELADVKEAGLDRLHTGLESGDAETLKRLRKGASPAEMINAGKKAKDAGFELSEYVLVGAGGRDRLEEHALGSARVLNDIQPDFVRPRTLVAMHGTPLRKEQDSGDFVPTTPVEKLLEIRLFLETLELENCVLASDHHTNYIRAGARIIYPGLNGTLPKDKDSMLSQLDSAIALIEAGKFEPEDANMLYESGMVTGL